MTTNAPRTPAIVDAGGKPVELNLRAGSQATVYVVPARPLTAGEIAMSRQLFKDSIDYAKVKVHNETYIPLQAINVAMTPNGEIYFHPDSEDYQDDFSSSVLTHPKKKIPYEKYKMHSIKHLFIHEMGHIWQHCMGEAVAVKGALLHSCFRIGVCSDPYYYRREPGKVFEDYNMEQRAEILANYYALKFWVPTYPEAYRLLVQNDEVLRAEAGKPGFYGKYAELLADYERILEKLLAKPDYKKARKLKVPGERRSEHDTLCLVFTGGVDGPPVDGHLYHRNGRT